MKKILIVDDDSNFCEVLKVRLESSGYEVTTASNGVVAFVKANDERPDLIILDVSMPGMDGLNFVLATRWKKEMKDIPILILTARMETKDLFNTLGIVHFMAKPFDSQELLGKVQECIMNPPA